MKITFITNKYPNPVEENVLVFLQQLVWSMADKGIECTVICPVPVNINPKYIKFPYKTYEKTENGSEVTVYFPKYIGFGQSEILGYNPARITTNNFTRAIRRVMSTMNSKPDAVYGHFVTPAGIAAARIGKEFNIPSFLGYGEDSTRMIEHFGYEKAAKELEAITGVIAVSTKNKNDLLSVNAVDEEKIQVIPNGFRKERFYPRDKSESRKIFGLPEDKFIVAFVGSFDHRKGIERLINAVEKLNDVYVICAGKGKIDPSSDKCLFKGPVRHDLLPYFYSAADVFVLPTLNEGCSNAIIEAMACGLPIISSNLPFNDDILDESCSIRVDPTNIDEISKAILNLANNNHLLNKLQGGSLEKAKKLTLEKRAEVIINYIKEKSLIGIL